MLGLITTGAATIAGLGVVGGVLSAYKKAAPNMVILVTGAWLTGPYVRINPDTHTKIKVVKGGGTFVVPVLQKAWFQSLDTFNIDVEVSDIMTTGKVPVYAAANAVLRVGSDPDMIAIASEKILGLNEAERQNQMEQVVRGGLREVLSGLTPEEANDRAQFQESVIKSIKPTFDKLGLEITAFQITRIGDTNGYYESLATQQIVEKRAEARKAQAQADRDASIVEAENRSQAQKAQLQADQEIAKNSRDTEVAKAQYQAEINVEKEKAEQASLIARAEQEQILQEKNIRVKENELKATKIAEQEADNKVIAMKAEAEAEATKKLAEANANKIAKEGKAQADAQKQLAEALKENGQFALQKALIDNLPSITSSFAEAVSNIDNLTVFDGAKGVTNQMNAGLAQSLEFTKQATGLDLVEMAKQQAQGTRTLNQPVPVKETD